MNTHFRLLDWLVLATYFMGTMAVGFYFWRKSRTADAFTAAERSLPGWVCGLSIFATYLSSISFLALPGAAFANNWNPFVFSLSLPFATIIAVCFFVPHYRRSGEVSAYSHLESRFGPWARFYAGTCYLLTQIARMGVVMYLMTVPVSMLIGWDIRVVIVITGVCVTVYSFVGGVVAVIWNDALQAIVLIVGALVCLAIMMFGMPEGVGQIVDIATVHEKFSLGSFDLSFTEQTFWLVLIYGITINLQNFGIDQGYVQRYIASKSDAEARKSVWLGGLLYIPVSALFFLIGTTLFAWYQVNPAELAEVRLQVAADVLLQEGVDPNRVDYNQMLHARAETISLQQVGNVIFSHFIGSQLPMGVTGLVIAAILSAGMSTVSTSLNSSATLILSDWYKRLFIPDATNRQQMIVLYLATLLLGIVGTVIALILVRFSEGALDMWWTLSGIFAGGMAGLFMLGLMSRRATSTIGMAATALGVIVIAWMTLSPMWPADSATWLPRNPLHKYAIVVIGTATILVTGFIMTLAFASADTSRRVHADPQTERMMR